MNWGWDELTDVQVVILVICCEIVLGVAVWLAIG